MSFKFLPAIQKLKRQHGVVPVGSPEITFYFYKRFCRTAGERQLLDAEQKSHNEGQFILAQLADKISKDKGIPFEKAIEYIFKPSPEDSKYADDAGHLAAIQDFKPMLEYPEEMKQLNGLKAVTNNLQFVVATILMQTRAAFPIQLADNAAANAESVVLASLPFAITDKSVFKADGAKLTVVGNYQPTEDQITISILPLAQNLAANRTLFLVDFETGKEKIGCPEWSHDDTAVLPEEIVEAFYAFFQREEAGMDEIVVKTEDAEKNEQTPTQQSLLTPSEESVNPSLSTGEASTIESSPTVSVTPDSVPTTVI